MTAWISTVTPPVAGSAVSEANTGTAFQQLTQRTQYLYEMLTAAITGQALIAKGLPVTSNVEVGFPVYFNVASGKYEPALAQAVSPPETPGWFSHPTGDVVGVVISKDAANNATLLIAGTLNLSTFLESVGKTLDDLLDVGTFSGGGQFYLSATDIGKMTKIPTAVSSFIGTIDAAGRVTVNLNPYGGNIDAAYWSAALGNLVTQVEPYTAAAGRIPIEAFTTNPTPDNPATGAIKLATAPFADDPAVAADVTAVKTVVGKTLKKGPVTTKVVPGPGIEIISLDAVGDSTLGYYGRVKIAVAGLLGYYGDADLVVLNGAREEFSNGIHYLSLPKSKDTSIRFRIKLSANLGGTKVKLRLGVFLPSGGTMPSLSVKYRIVPGLTVGAASAVPVADTSIANMTSGLALTANQATLVESAVMPTIGTALPNDILFVEVTRTGSSDGYNGDVGLIESTYIFS